MEQHSHQPTGLNARQLARLDEHARHGQMLPPDRLLQAAYAHLEDVQGLHVKNPQIDAPLAAALCQIFDRIVSEWEAFTPVEQSWLRGALRYFSVPGDDFHDLQPGGFHDDLEVLNACLRFVGREQWILPEYDAK